MENGRIFRMIDKIAWLYIKDGQILTTRSKGKDAFYFPGGKREGIETDLETLTREIKAELSVDIRPDTTKPYGVFEAQAHGKAEGVVVRMTCYTADFLGDLKPDNEITEMGWITSKDTESVSPVDKLILADLKGKNILR